MDEAAITQYITDTFDGVDVVVAEGDSFFFYDPEHKFPFATLITKDNDFDNVSKLKRPSVFRLNIGIGKANYQALFGTPASSSDAGDAVDSGYDFAALDQMMPHPIYGRMYWVCVLNPSAATFQTVQPLLAEAYAISVRKQTKARRTDR